MVTAESNESAHLGAAFSQRKRFETAEAAIRWDCEDATSGRIRCDRISLRGCREYSSEQDVSVQSTGLVVGLHPQKKRTSIVSVLLFRRP